VPLKLKEQWHKPGEAVTSVYFPEGGFLSIVTVLEDGRLIEVATVGNEGMVGLSALVENVPALSGTMVQGEGAPCSRMSAVAFRREMARGGVFSRFLARYTQAHMGVIMLSTACNAVHAVEQRLARWLLLAHDRMEGDEFPLTQEFVAMMLGVTRPTVTLVAGTLQKSGLIRYHRGRVGILNRTGLESASCECYRAATTLLESVTAG